MRTRNVDKSNGNWPRELSPKRSEASPGCVSMIPLIGDAKYMFKTDKSENPKIYQKPDHHADHTCREMWPRLSSRTVAQAFKRITWMLWMIPLIDGVKSVLKPEKSENPKKGPKILAMKPTLVHTDLSWINTSGPELVHAPNYYIDEGSDNNLWRSVGQI